MNTNTARNEARSRHMSAALGPKITESESNAIDAIREQWELLSPEIRQELLAELVRKIYQ